MRRSRLSCSCGKVLTGKQKKSCSVPCYHRERYAEMRNLSLPVYRQLKPRRKCIECGTDLGRGFMYFCSHACSVSGNNRYVQPLANEAVR